MTLLNTPNILQDINKRRGVAQRGLNQGTVNIGQDIQGQNLAPLLTRAQNIENGGSNSAYTVEENIEEYQEEEAEEESE